MIKENLQRIKEQMPASVELVAVSKYRPLEDLQQAYDAGQRVFAESRPAEFEEKVKALPGDIQWHFIGHLQTNKLKMVLPYADLIHSVDSEHLLEAIERFAAAADMTVNVLIEIHVAEEESKQGFTPLEAERFFDRDLKAAYPHIKIRGLMGMASNTDNPATIDRDFSNMEALFNRIKETHPGMTEFRELSIGMSNDWKTALKHSATMVRIGSAIFAG